MLSTLRAISIIFHFRMIPAKCICYALVIGTHNTPSKWTKCVNYHEFIALTRFLSLSLPLSLPPLPLSSSFPSLPLSLYVACLPHTEHRYEIRTTIHEQAHKFRYVRDQIYDIHCKWLLSGYNLRIGICLLTRV